MVFNGFLFLLTVSKLISCTRIEKADVDQYSNITKLFRTKRDEQLTQALQGYSPVLKAVGLFMAAQKYVAKDARYRGREFLSDRSYFRHFPIPRLKQLDRRVAEACEKGAFSCLQLVYSKAKDFNRSDRPGYNKLWPFFDKLDLFRFRTTASYFLCMFTLEKNPLMEKLHQKGRCLAGFSETREVKEAGVSVNDWRDDNVPFRCCRIFYCPDPCYGRKSEGNVVSQRAMRTDIGNPCRALKDTHCAWAPEENRNFEGLTRNRFNITCNCNRERRGYKWSSRFRMCVDKDECYERHWTCGKGKICQNTNGGVVCVCKRGKKLNSTTDECEDVVILPKITAAVSVTKKTKEKSSFIRRLEILFGLSSAGTKEKHSLLTVLLPAVILCATFG